jgi:hypothetical protein
MIRRLGRRNFKVAAKMDMTSGYHQVMMDADSSRLAAFKTEGGTFAPTRLMFGKKCAPAYFQGHMASTVLGDLNKSICEVYIDDVITWGQTDEEFLRNLETLFERFRLRKVTLNPDKCEFGLTELEFVGHVINSEGIKMSKEKINKALDFPLPQTVKDLRSYVGLVNYFSEHIPNLSMLLIPLLDMVKRVQAAGGGKLLSKRLSKKAVLVWSTEERKAFEKVQQAVERCPMLFFFNETDEIYLLTDASDHGIGAYLYQVVDGKEKPIRFLSRTLKGAQTRWSTTEKECFAIVEALKEFEYLLGSRRFHLLTDHKSLTFMSHANGNKILADKLTR